VICLVSVSFHTYVALTYPAFIKYDSRAYIGIMAQMEKGEFELEKLPYHRAPGYPAFLLTIKTVFGNYALLGLRTTQHFFGFLTSIMAFFIAFYLSRDLIFAAGATLISFLSLDNLLFHNFIMTEPLYTFLLVCFLLLSIKALTLISNRLFVSSLVLAAVLEYIRPGGIMIVLLLLTFWILRVLLAEWKKCSDVEMIDCLKSTLSILLNGKFILTLLAGLCVYIVATAPVQLKTYLRAGPYYFAAKSGLYFWVSSVYLDELSLPIEEVKVHNFLKDYEAWKTKVKMGIEPVSVSFASAHEPWQPENVFRHFLNKKDGWRWHPMAIAALRAERNWSYDRSWAFLGEIASQVFRENALMYIKRMPQDIFTLLTKMPDWLPKGILMDIYKSAASNPLYKMLYMLFLSIGAIGGLFLFRRIEYLFLLAIIFQHIGTHVLVGPELARYRFPISPLLAISYFAGIWSLVVLYLFSSRAMHQKFVKTSTSTG